MSTYTYKTLHWFRFKESKDLTTYYYTHFFVKRKIDMNAFLSQEIENNVTKVPVFLQLRYEFDITII